MSLNLIPLLSLLSLATASARLCPEGYYLDRVSEICHPCSDCPINQIIRRPCASHRDTVCGPFYEFEFFNHDAGEAEEDQDQVGEVEKVRTIEQESLQEIKQEGIKDSQGPWVQGDVTEWQELCYGLIAALVSVTLLALIYVFLTQLRARRASAGKTITVHDPSDPLVYYQAQIISPPSTSSTAPSTATTPSTSKRTLTAALDTQLRINDNRRSFIQRFLGGHHHGNAYVDPLGRVYGGDEDITHPFVRVPTPEEEVRAPIYVPQIHNNSHSRVTEMQPPLSSV